MSKQAGTPLTRLRRPAGHKLKVTNMLCGRDQQSEIFELELNMTAAVSSPVKQKSLSRLGDNIRRPLEVGCERGVS